MWYVKSNLSVSFPFLNQIIWLLGQRERNVIAIKEFLWPTWWTKYSINTPRHHQPSQSKTYKIPPRSAYWYSRKAVSALLSYNYNSLYRLCSGNNHKLYHCNNFLQLSKEERLRWVQRQHLCVNCFGSDHNLKICNSGYCTKCTNNTIRCFI